MCHFPLRIEVHVRPLTRRHSDRSASTESDAGAKWRSWRRVPRQPILGENMPRDGCVEARIRAAAPPLTRVVDMIDHMPTPSVLRGVLVHVGVFVFPQDAPAGTVKNGLQINDLRPRPTNRRRAVELVVVANNEICSIRMDVRRRV